MVAPPQEPTTINDLPFGMVDIDAAATIHDLNAKNPTSGVSSVEWFHDRPAEEGIINTPEGLFALVREVVNRRGDGRELLRAALRHDARRRTAAPPCSSETATRRLEPGERY